jgi:hypothetical protein
MPERQRWIVELTDEYIEWFETLDRTQRRAVVSDIEILERFGPSLGRPHVDSIKGSKHSNMKELRTIHARRHLRSFFVFDPRRTAILLIGGDKTGDPRFYGRMIPIADRLYGEYLAEIRKEGLIP